MKRSRADSIIERVRTRGAQVEQSVASYLAPTGGSTSTDRTQELIAGNPTASELLARGYPQYVAERVARSQEEQ